MRDYKFRYFDRLTGKMEGFGGMPMLIEELESVNDRENMPVMQYTGLQDKNGIEIYEKDHVLIRGAGNTVYLRTIEFEQGTFHFGNVKDGMCDYRDMEVVGNTFEGTYLLEGDRK